MSAPAPSSSLREVGVVIAEPGGRLVRSSAALETIWGHPFVPSSSISEYQAYQGYHPDGRPYAPEEWPLARSLLHGETVVREPVTLLHQGNPIPPELLPHIFEPFTRASEGGNALKGVGLGLFIVHEIVAAHGGRIDVSSSAATGTIFRVRLPRTPTA